MNKESITNNLSSDFILKNISRHITLDKPEIDFFISMLQSKIIKKKEFLFHPGEICKYQNFVSKGCLRCYSVDDNGLEHNGYFAVEGWWTGDLHSFLTQTPATQLGQAIEDSEVLQISKLNLESLYENVPKFERFFRILFQNSLISISQRLMQNISLTAEERYLSFIIKYPLLEQRISQKQVASYLGITPEFLSILRKKLSKG